MSLADRLVDRRTRRGALETALIGRVLLDGPDVLRHAGALALTPTGAVLLEIALDGLSVARLDLPGEVRLALRIAAHGRHSDREPRWVHLLFCERATTGAAVHGMAIAVAQATVCELCEVGPLSSVFALLAETPPPAAKRVA